MSNYIRTLLRFEKEREGRRAAEEAEGVEPKVEDTSPDGPKRPMEDFWTTAPDAGESKSKAKAKEHGKRSDTPTDSLPLWPEPPRATEDRLPTRGVVGRLLDRLPLGYLERRRQRSRTRASAHHATAYAQLLDSLRAVETPFAAPGVVIAAAGSSDAVEAVVHGLRGQARSKGVRLMVAELVVTQSGRILEGRDPACPAEPLVLNRTVTEDTVRAWFERATVGQDLLVVSAPSLSQSVDAGLLARACDGLAIVVEPQQTNHHEFETAIERAKASGAFLLGLVMSHHTHWLPHFMRSFFSSYPRLIRQRPRSR